MNTGIPGHGPPGSRDGKVLREVDPHLHSPCTGEHTRSTHGPQTPRGPLPRSSCTPSDLGFCGAPGRIRTCDRRIRSSMVTYRHVSLRAVVTRTVRIRMPFCVASCRPVMSRSKTAEHERSTHRPLDASDGTLLEPRELPMGTGACAMACLGWLGGLCRCPCDHCRLGNRDAYQAPASGALLEAGRERET